MDIPELKFRVDRRGGTFSYIGVYDSIYSKYINFPKRPWIIRKRPFANYHELMFLDTPRCQKEIRRFASFEAALKYLEQHMASHKSRAIREFIERFSAYSRRHGL